MFFLLHSIAWHDTACHGMVWDGMAWHGMAWHAMAFPPVSSGMALHAMAKKGMAWHGISPCLQRHGIYGAGSGKVKKRDACAQKGAANVNEGCALKHKTLFWNADPR